MPDQYQARTSIFVFLSNVNNDFPKANAIRVRKLDKNFIRIQLPSTNHRTRHWYIEIVPECCLESIYNEIKALAKR